MRSKYIKVLLLEQKLIELEKALEQFEEEEEGPAADEQ